MKNFRYPQKLRRLAFFLCPPLSAPPGVFCECPQNNAYIFLSVLASELILFFLFFGKTSEYPIWCVARGDSRNGIFFLPEADTFGTSKYN